MAITQKQIAERLNVSRSLVARALRNDLGLPESTRQRVAEMAQEMGYDSDSNSSARTLIGQRYGHRVRHGTIAAIFCTSDVIAMSSLPFYVPILEGMDRQAELLGIDVCVCSSRGDRLPHIVRERNVDGVISVGLYPKHIVALGPLNLPQLTLGWRRDGANSAMPDDREGARLATRHLLELGHRRIAFLGASFLGNHDELIYDDKMRPLHIHSARLRLQGYLDAMQEFGITVSPQWIETGLAPPDASRDSYCISQCGACAACAGWSTLVAKNGGRHGKELPFTAIVCHNDSIGMGVTEKAMADGIDVPGDLSITGFDNLSHHHNFKPQLTSVKFSGDNWGQNAVRLLHEIICDEDARRAQEAGEDPEYRHFVEPVVLAIHASTRAPRIL